MKITIDENVCKKHGLELDQVLYALALKHMQQPMLTTMANLQKKEVIAHGEGKYYLTPRWEEEIDTIIAESCISNNEENLMILAKKMRNLFPAGKQQGRQSSPYYYRCNNKEVMNKLKKFFSIYGNYTDEELLDATKRYVDSFHGDYRGMRLIKYFIIKDEVKPTEDEDGNVVNKVVQISDLATYLENEESDKGIDDGSWLMSARN